MVQPDILVPQALRVFILVISFHRILKDALCEIKTAVTVNAPAHQIVDLFFLCFA